MIRPKRIPHNLSQQLTPPGIKQCCLTIEIFSESLIRKDTKYEDTTHCNFSERIALPTARKRGRRCSGRSHRSDQRIQSSVSLSGRAADWLRQRFETDSFGIGAPTQRSRSLAKSRRYQNCGCVETRIGCFHSIQGRCGTEGRSCNRARRKASRRGSERLLVWQRVVSRCGCGPPQ